MTMLETATNIGRRAEDVVRKQLATEFRQGFSRKKLLVGSKSWQFDVVSDDEAVVGQVKSCRKKFDEHTPAQLETRFQRDYIFDCLLLARVKADTKLFFLVADQKLFKEFVSWTGDLLPEVEMRWVDVQRLLMRMPSI